MARFKPYDFTGIKDPESFDPTELDLPVFDPLDYDPTGGYLTEIGLGTAKGLLGKGLLGGLVGHFNPVDVMKAVATPTLAKTAGRVTSKPFGEHWMETLGIDTPAGRWGTKAGSLLTNLLLGPHTPLGLVGMFASPFISKFLGPLFGYGLQELGQFLGLVTDPQQQELFDYIRGGAPDPPSSFFGEQESLYETFLRESDPMYDPWGGREPLDYAPGDPMDDYDWGDWEDNF